MARPAFGCALFGFASFAVFRVRDCGFAVRRAGFLTDFFGFTGRRRDVAFLPAALARRRLVLAAFAFVGRPVRCLGLDRLFFPDFLAMLPPLRSD
jgi:hypothetical protein